ncbi:MAG TPA: Uma2 family endonuclease [Terriglobia bacterium]|nr:Uma2 family endonuclease [Terriglobia bacterium]
MSSLRRPEHYSLDEYLALERASERRFEYRNGEIVCMSGGSAQHAEIAANIIAYLKTKLRGRSCHVYGSDLAIDAPGGRPYRYPDVSVVCGERRIEEVDGRDCLSNPVILVEVLSPASASYDLGVKFEEYKSIPTLTDYILVAQDRPYVIRRTRDDRNTWRETAFESLDATVHLESVDVNLDMRDVYEGLEFQQTAED